jgi:hypothetical protein
MINPVEPTQEDYLLILDLAETELRVARQDGQGDTEFAKSLERIAKWATFEAGVAESITCADLQGD